MPRGDRTGPQGQGSRTGRRQGRCTAEGGVPDFRGQVGFGTSRDSGRGAGQGPGRGGGRGRRKGGRKGR